MKGLRIRVTTTYLDNIYKIGDGKEVIGRGIDFSFRLEKYADTSHIVVNEMFFKSLDFDKYVNRSIECEKTAKGWTEPQKFYIIVLDEKGKAIKDMIENLAPSVYSNDVHMELFKHYIESEKLSNKEDERKNGIDLENDFKTGESDES